ncbi:MAG: phage holin family protein [Methyloglobulus sp.]
MDSNAIKDGMPPPTATHGVNESDSSVLEDTQSLWHELLGLSHDRFHLAGLETQQAGLSLVNMVMAGVLVAGLLCGAWLGLLAAVVLGLVENGFMSSSAILLAVVLNLLLALIFCRFIRHKSHYLKFPATLRSLHPSNGIPGHEKVTRA